MTEVKLNPVPPTRNPSLYDFDVVCDETNNDAATVDRNELHVDVFIRGPQTYRFFDPKTNQTMLRLTEFPNGDVVVHAEDDRHD